MWTNATEGPMVEGWDHSNCYRNACAVGDILAFLLEQTRSLYLGLKWTPVSNSSPQIHCSQQPEPVICSCTCQPDTAIISHFVKQCLGMYAYLSTTQNLPSFLVAIRQHGVVEGYQGWGSYSMVKIVLYNIASMLL